MKKMYVTDNEGSALAIMGIAEEIRVLEKALARHERRHWQTAHWGRMFDGTPTFKVGEVYALTIDEEGWWCVNNSTTISWWLLDGLLQPSRPWGFPW